MSSVTRKNVWVVLSFLISLTYSMLGEQTVDFIESEAAEDYTALRFNPCINGINSKVCVVNSKVDQVLSEESVIESLLEGVNVNLASCCQALNSKIDITIDLLGAFDISTIETLRTEIEIISSLSQQLVTTIETIVSFSDILENNLGSIVDIIEENISITEVIESKTDACCTTINSKLDRIGSLESTIESKIDTVDRALISCCALVNSKLDVVMTNESVIESLIESLNPCGATPIMQVMIPFTITQAGTYCVAETLMDPPGAIITIAASDVTLDLNGQLLQVTTTGSTAITTNDASPLHSIVIMNGFLESTAPGSSTGIAIGTGISGHSGITISSIIDNGFSTSLMIDKSSTILLENMLLTGPSTITNSSFAIIKNCTFQGLTATSCTSCTLENCTNGANAMSFNNGTDNTIINSTSKQASTGFIINNETNFYAENCVASKNNNNGFSVTSATNSTFINCGSENNTGDGFNLTSNVESILVKDCVANNNSVNGFDIIVTPNLQFENCVAQSNGSSAGDAGFKFVSGTGMVKECMAVGNTFCGFDDDSAALVGTAPAVTAVITPFSYVANSAKKNGATPGNVLADTNYCVGGTGTTFPVTLASLLLANPYFQVTPFSAASYWNNVTMSQQLP